jgi:GT2 family glycosyltransferase
MEFEDSQPLVSIITVNYNGVSNLGELFTRFLESLKRQNYKKTEIIMVDNASTDNSIHIAKKVIPNIKLIQLKENVGYNRAVNIGVYNSKGQIIIICNNDVILDESFLNKALAVFLKIKKEYSITPVVVVPLQIIGDGDRIMGTMPVLNFLGQALYIDYRRSREYFTRISEKLPDKWRGIFPDGACFITDRETILNLGILLNPFFFMYFDDVELGIRLFLIGGMVFLVKDLVIYHKLATTSSKVLSHDKFIHFSINRLATLFSLLKPYQLLLLPLLIVFDIGQLFLIYLHSSNCVKDEFVNIILKYVVCLRNAIPVFRRMRAHYNSLRASEKNIENIFSEYLFLPRWFCKEIFSRRGRKILFLITLYVLNAIAIIIRLRPIRKILCIDTLI